jgi:hypothetical protein
VPWLGDLPYLGAAFRFRTQVKSKNELMVILTPHVVRNRMEADRVLAEEAARMDWMVDDVTRYHGLSGMEPVLHPQGFLPPVPTGDVDGCVTPPTGPALVPPPPSGAETLPPPRTVAPGETVPPPVPGPATLQQTSAPGLQGAAQFMPKKW